MFLKLFMKIWIPITCTQINIWIEYSIEYWIQISNPEPFVNWKEGVNCRKGEEEWERDS